MGSLVLTALTLTQIDFFFDRVYAFIFFRRALVILGLFFHQQTIVAIRRFVSLSEHSKLLVVKFTLLFHVVDRVRNKRANLTQTLIWMRLLLRFSDGLLSYIFVPLTVRPTLCIFTIFADFVACILTWFYLTLYISQGRANSPSEATILCWWLISLLIFG